MRLFDWNELGLENAHAAFLWQVFHEGLIDGHTGGEKYRVWLNDVVFSRTIQPDEPLPDLAATGYVFPQRWQRLIREYLDIPQLQARKAEITKKSYPYSEYQYNFHSKFASHTHTKGNCLMSFTFRIPKPSVGIPRINAFTRSTFFVPVGVMDFALLVCIGRYLFGDIPFQLNWFISQLQLSGWRMMPFAHYHGIKDLLLGTTPHPNAAKLQENLRFAFDHAHDQPYLDRQKYLMPVRFSKSLWKVEAGVESFIPSERENPLGIMDPIGVGEELLLPSEL